MDERTAGRTVAPPSRAFVGQHDRTSTPSPSAASCSSACSRLHRRRSRTPPARTIGRRMSMERTNAERNACWTPRRSNVTDPVEGRRTGWNGHLRPISAMMRIAPALASTIAFATGAFATVIPGGGPARSACYVVLDGAGTRALRTARILECVDGDPSCDLDGLCNDRCEFGLRVCINQPGLAGCTPPRALDRLRLRYTPPTVTVRPPAVLQGPVCGDAVDARVAVIQRPNVACTSAVCSGRKRPGRALVTAIARAVRGTRPRFDRDSYVLRCLRAPRRRLPRAPEVANGLLPECETSANV